MADAIAAGLGADQPAVADAPQPEPQEVDEPREDAAGEALRGPDGKFAKKGNDAKPELKKADPKDAVKPEDDLTAPLEGLSEKGQRRFQKLVNANKELTGKVQAFEEKAQSFEAFQSVLRENGVQREQFDVAVDFIGAFNRGDLRGALQILDEQRAAIAEMAGVELPGIDLLHDFGDLQQAVQQQQMPREAAVELAARRRREAQMAAEREAQQSEAAQGYQFEQQRDSALREIDQFIVAMQRDDLDFQAKAEALESEIVEACKELPPAQWASAVKRMYRLAGKVRPAMPAPAAGSPLRPAGNATGARPTPRSMAEAVSAGLGYDA